MSGGDKLKKVDATILRASPGQSHRSRRPMPRPRTPPPRPRRRARRRKEEIQDSKRQGGYFKKEPPTADGKEGKERRERQEDAEKES